MLCKLLNLELKPIQYEFVSGFNAIIIINLRFLLFNLVEIPRNITGYNNIGDTSNNSGAPGAPWVRNYGNPSVRENLVLGLYDHMSTPPSMPM